MATKRAVFGDDIPLKDRLPDDDLPVKFAFAIDGKAQAKERARVYYDKRSQRVRSYTPERTADYESRVRAAYRQSGGKYYGKTRMVVKIAAFFEFPKSYSRKKVQELWDGGVRPTAKPDCDNIIKSILDGLNGVAYYDDSWVVEVSCEKHYAAVGVQSYVYVELKVEDDNTRGS